MPYIGKSPVTGNYNSLDDMSGSFNSSTTTFNLLVNSGTALTPVRAEALIISINGVIQEPGTDFTVSAATMTYTTAPASTDSFFGVVLGQQLDIATPGDGSVSTAKIADGAVTIAKLGSALTDIADGSVTSPTIANSGDTNTGLYWPAADTLGVTTGGTEQFRFGSNPIPGGNKNLLINGAMSVSQRGTSFTSFGASDSEYGVDRWKIRSISSASARWTASQESSGGDSGKDKYLKILCTTADGSPGTNETQWITQTIEGFNSTSVVADDASTKAISVSLDIIGHADGSSSISFPAKVAVFIDMSAGASREYVHDVTIAAADTWERVTFSAPVDSFDDWTTDNAANLGIGISLYGGSGRVGAEDTYRASGRDNITSNTDNWADATNNYIGFTNVQLEVGGVATDFAYEDIGTTLQKCQRYGVGFANLGANAIITAAGSASSTTRATVGFWYPTTMRAEPTLTATGSDFQLSDGASSTNMTGFSIAEQSPQMIAINCDVSSGLTQFRPYWLKQDGSSSRSFFLSAEL